MPPKRTTDTKESSPKRAKAAPAARAGENELEGELNALIQRAKDGKFDKVFEILDKCPSYVNERPEARMYGTIHQAAYWGDMAAIKKLLEKYSADVLSLTKDGKTALEVAKENGHDAVAKYLEAKETKLKEPSKSSAEFKPFFPLDQGKFNLLVVTGMSAREAVFGNPDESGRLVAGGEDSGGDPIDDAAMLEDRLLTIKGDPAPAAEDPGDSYTSTAWSREVKLHAENAPILLGWRVNKPDSGLFTGPCFGLTTRQHLTTNAGYTKPTAVLGFCPWEKKSEVVCSQTSFTVGSEIEMKLRTKTPGGAQPGVPLEGKVAEIVDGKYVIDYQDPYHSGKQLREVDVDASSMAGVSVKLDCESSPSPSGGEVIGLSADAEGAESETKKIEYDVLVVFDTLKKEVRASVGWGGPGSRTDKVVVPSELWPTSNLPLVPFAWLQHIDGGATLEMDEELLPITIEALTSQQMAEEAVCALMGA